MARLSACVALGGLCFAVAVSCGGGEDGATFSGSGAGKGGSSASGGESVAGAEPFAVSGGTSGAAGRAALEADAGAGGTEPAPFLECELDTECEATLGTSTPAGCAEARCVGGRCEYQTLDRDGDGHGTAVCQAADVELPAGDDCDDDDARVHPGAWDGPAASGKDDSCDDVDNDCNLTADDASVNGKTCECDPATDVDLPCAMRPDGTAIAFPGGAAQGSCQLGKRSCVDGAFGACTGAVEPKAKDSCGQANDDDCDGTPNNGSLPNPDCACVAGSTETCGVALGKLGACAQGSVQCSATGQWQQCNVQPSSEVCTGNGVDEDCDGSVNEADACECVNGTTTTCAAVIGNAAGGVGACAAKTVTCQNGAWNKSACIGSSEVCDCGNTDDDCDGQANEGCSCCNGQTQGCGACGLDSQTCSNGSWGGCSGNTIPSWNYDGDGDGYCGPSTSSCGWPGSGWKTPPCASECNDANPYTTECANTGSEDFYLGTFAKPFNFGCLNKYYPVACPAGKHLVDCLAAKTAGGGAFTDLDDRIDASECGVRICDVLFETATTNVYATCIWN